MPEEAKRCATCGGELLEGRCSACANKAVSKIVRLDAARLFMLSAIAIFCIVGTRAVAKLDQESDRKQAAAFYARGMDALHKGDEKQAIEQLRDATIHDRHDAKYALALGEALSGAGQDDEALQLLLRIREDSPEDPEINSQIARVEAKRHDLTDAELYYHHALYGIWQGDNADARRRQIRLELIQFLTQHNQRNAALAELLALQAEAPKDPGIQTEAATLDLQLGDARAAKTVYEQLLRGDRKNLPALNGVAQADYRLGQFTAATRAISAAAAQTATLPPEIVRLKGLLQWIDDHDPTRRGLTRSERMDRMNQDVAQVLQRVQTCAAQKTVSDASRRQLQDMEGQLVTFQNNFNGTLDLSLQDALQDGFDVISRAEDLATSVCPGSDADEALAMLTRTKGNSER